MYRRPIVARYGGLGCWVKAVGNREQRKDVENNAKCDGK